MTLIAFLMMLVPLVVFHELGHFLVCKAFGVKVTQFAIGFGKKIVGFHFKGTEYRWNLIPLGGYVDFMGEAVWNEEIPQDPNHFYNKGKFVRFLVLIMGPAFNVLLAYVVLWGIFAQPTEMNVPVGDKVVVGTVQPDSPEAMAGLQVNDEILRLGETQISSFQQLNNEMVLRPKKDVVLTVLRGAQEKEITFEVIEDDKSKGGKLHFYPAYRLLVESVQEKSPAELAGLQAGDHIIALDDEPVYRFAFPDASFAEKLNDGREFPVKITYKRGEHTLETEITPDVIQRTVVQNEVEKEIDVHVIGIIMTTDTEMVDRSIGEAAIYTWNNLGYYSSLIYRFLWGIVKAEISPRAMSSAPGMAREAKEALDMGWIYFLEFLAIISLNLAIVNLLPIPVLDGGEIFVILVEWISRREFDLTTKMKIKRIGLVFLLCLMSFVLISDTLKFF